MSHYAKVVNRTVVEIIVAEQEFFETFIDTNPGEWVQTSYNDNIRGLYAGVGMIYDIVNDVFYDAQPHPSWILNSSTYLWESPVAMPEEGQYVWDEATTSWKTNKKS